MSNSVTNFADGLLNESLELTYETDGSEVATPSSPSSQTSGAGIPASRPRMSYTGSDEDEVRVRRAPSESCSDREQRAPNARAEPGWHGQPWGERWTYARRQHQPTLRPGNFGAKLDAAELLDNNRHSSLARWEAGPQLHACATGSAGRTAGPSSGSRTGVRGRLVHRARSGGLSQWHAP